jgi:hypothetical protein
MGEPAFQISLLQPSLLELCPVTAAVQAVANSGIEARGAIFTRREVVEFILDLVGYTADKPLHELRLLEPSFGGGDFLLTAIDRLLEAWVIAGRPEPLSTLAESIRAVELHRASFSTTRNRVVLALNDAGIAESTAEALAEAWLIFGDFLLVPLGGSFNFVIGNPPYVRQELIPDALMVEYRARYQTIYDRADLYVPFIERSLNSLGKGGQLGFICADRWMKNRYGALLRKMVAERFHLKVYVDMVDTPAFHSDVIAYPAITVIARENPAATRIAHRPEISAEALSSLAALLVAKEHPAPASGVREMRNATAGAEPWILESSDQLSLVRRLEQHFPTLEEAGCKVGIGVATGADQAFIGKFDALDVEPDRKEPLVMTRDILAGHVEWRGYGVINPFADNGKLVDLNVYPRLRRYLEARRDDICGRHVAQKAPASWYRTIDRIYPELTLKPKLLIPDIKGAAHIVYEEGRLYPHHNLYFITSDCWELKALQAVLLSGIARLFVSIYSTKMRGGYLRFQAQYLRRIRVPHWSKVPVKVRRELAAAAERKDVAACNRAVFALYRLTSDEKAALGGNGA